MNAGRILKSLPALRAYGPYLLIEVLLPGGTLLALLLWLSQRWEGIGVGSVQRQMLREMGYRAAISAKPHALPDHPSHAIGGLGAVAA
jgi:hypothetical protein